MRVRLAAAASPTHRPVSFGIVASVPVEITATAEEAAATEMALFQSRHQGFPREPVSRLIDEAAKKNVQSLKLRSGTEIVESLWLKQQDSERLTESVRKQLTTKMAKMAIQRRLVNEGDLIRIMSDANGTDAAKYFYLRSLVVELTDHPESDFPWVGVSSAAQSAAN